MKSEPREILSGTKKTRSCGYPMLALPRAIDAAKALYENFGEGPYPREAAAKGLGYSSFSGAASGKIGSLVHFGMLTRSGGMYSMAPMGREAFSYPAEGSQEAIAVLAQNPVLYRKLISRFLNKSLPEKLEAILSAEYGITQKAAAMAAQNFIETMEFAGLIREGHLVLSQTEFGARGEKIFKSAEKNNAEASEATIKVKLLSGIELSFPEKMAYRLSMGEFMQPIKDLDDKAGMV
jgi:hypothetical protein